MIVLSQIIISLFKIIFLDDLLVKKKLRSEKLLYETDLQYLLMVLIVIHFIYILENRSAFIQEQRRKLPDFQVFVFSVLFS